MFAYCNNNPVLLYDPNGCSSHVYDDYINEEALEGIVAAGGGGFANAYNPIDAGYSYHVDFSMAANSSSFTGGILTNGYTEYSGSSFLTGDAGTVVYRWNCTNAKNLRPSNKDVLHNSGLSFSTQYRPGSARTTIGQINATGVLYARKDGDNHISVYPVGGTIEAWRNGGVNSKWTVALLSVVEFID